MARLKKKVLIEEEREIAQSEKLIVKFKNVKT